MIPYEEYLPLLPHEYTYAQFLSYEFDLWMYDPMILNMVSERYPRYEDDASNFDSDSVTDEDLSNSEFEVPPWLFQDLEDEDVSQLLSENNDLKIVFGSFGKSSDLDAISSISFKPIKPEIEECTVKIGQINCFLNKVKPETRKCGDASSLLDLVVKDEEEKHTTVKNECTFFDIRSTVNLEKEVSLAPNHFLVPKIEPDQFHHSRFGFAKLVSPSIVLPSPEKIVEFVDFAFGCNDRISNQAMKVDYETVKKPPDPANQLHTVLFQIVSSIETVCTKRPTQPDLDYKFFSEIIPLNSVRSSSFFNQNSISLLAADDDFLRARSFLNLAILEEIVKERYLEDPRCEVPYVVKNFLFPICRGIDVFPLSVVGIEKETASPWKVREEDEVLFVSLWNLLSSPEPLVWKENMCKYTQSKTSNKVIKNRSNPQGLMNSFV